VPFEATQRLGNIPPYPFATLGKQISQLNVAGHDVIRLDMGSPDLPPPPQVIEALAESSRSPANHGYPGFAGTPELRQAFADYYNRRFGVELDVNTQVLVLIGSKEGVANLALAWLDPGDIALVPDPAYPVYEMGAILAGASSHPVPLVPERGFMPDIDSIPRDVLKEARLLWINYPNNPTGAVASLEDLEQIVTFCREHGLLLCSDNPYADVTFDGFRAPSVLQIEGAFDVAVEFNSLSKTYNMAGWRVGVCAGNPQAVEALGSVKSNIDSGVFRPIQDAATVALNEVGDEWINERNTVYQRRRDMVMEALASVGLEAEPPRAALYVWARVVDGDDEAYACDALEEAFVSVTAGRVYGKSGMGYVRISLVTNEERLRLALDRLIQWRSQ
jgi:LL-diaminopimelate aminotransferase